MSKHFEKHISIEAPDVTVLQHLAEHTTLSKQQLKNAMTNGALWLESSIGIHRIRRAKKILKSDDVLHFYYDETIQHTKPEAAQLIADENEYSIWNKPYGMYSQGTKWGDHCTIYRWAEQHLTPQRPAFLVHRLDRAANGLIIIAHSKKMAATFSTMFKKHEIQKHYKARVEGVFNEAVLPFSIKSDIDSKSAHSTIIAFTRREKSTDVIIEIKTGRKHQVRRHLAEIGFPIIGDRLYGVEKCTLENSTPDLQLQSYFLKFNCPLTNSVREYSLD